MAALALPRLPRYACLIEPPFGGVSSTLVLYACSRVGWLLAQIHHCASSRRADPLQGHRGRAFRQSLEIRAELLEGRRLLPLRKSQLQANGNCAQARATHRYEAQQRIGDVQ